MFSSLSSISCHFSGCRTGKTVSRMYSVMLSIRQWYCSNFDDSSGFHASGLSKHLLATNANASGGLKGRPLEGRHLKMGFRSEFRNRRKSTFAPKDRAVVRGWYTMETGRMPKMGKTWKLCPDRDWGQNGRKIGPIFHFFFGIFRPAFRHVQSGRIFHVFPISFPFLAFGLAISRPWCNCQNSQNAQKCLTRVRKVFSGLRGETPKTVSCTVRNPFLGSFPRCETGFGRCERLFWDARLEDPK